MKLARKIVLAVGVLALLVIGALETFGVLRDLRASAAEMLHAHRVLGETLGAAIGRAWAFGGSSEALELVEVANRSQAEVSVRWVWLEDAPVDRAALRRERFVSRDVDSPSPGRLVSWTLVRAGDRDGALEISQSLAVRRQLLVHNVVAALAASVVLGTLFLAAAGFLGRRLVGRPIDVLVGLARRLGRGELAARADLPDRDELGALAAAMHSMADDLSVARREADREYTARVEALQHLRHSDRLATVGKLAAGVAHEIGTPLNVSAARARMIEIGEAEGEEVRESARIIGVQIRAITAIVRQLLDFARPRKANREREDLSRLVQGAARLLSPLAARKSVEFDTSGAPPLDCDVDASQLNQVLTNLLMNAVHAMHRPGTVAVRLDAVQARPPTHPHAPQESWVRIQVQDTGVGIPPEARPHIFEPFFTTKDVGEGTGLGLSVSWGIVQEHGGWIDVESAPGGGSTFSVFLPARENECRDGSSP